MCQNQNCIGMNENFKKELYVGHCVLRVLNTSFWDPRCQTYVFESRIAQGIQVWVQNNQLPALPSTIFFKNCFGCKKNHEKNRTLR